MFSTLNVVGSVRQAHSTAPALRFLNMNLSQRLALALKEAPGGPMRPIQLAKAAKVARATISLIATGKTQTITSKNATKIAAVLGVRVEWLVDGEKPMRVGDPYSPTKPLKDPELKRSDPLVARPMTSAQKALSTIAQSLAGFIPDDQCKTIAKLIQEASTQALALEKARSRH